MISELLNTVKLRQGCEGEALFCVCLFDAKKAVAKRSPQQPDRLLDDKKLTSSRRGAQIRKFN